MKSTQTTAVFRSASDYWLVGAVVAIVAAALLLALNRFRLDDSEWLGLYVAVFGVLPALMFVSWVWQATDYTLASDHLYVRCGPLHWTVPYAHITEIAPSWAAWSAPALSLRRLRIHYGAGLSLLISPVERERFLRMLLGRCPQLHGRGERFSVAQR
jgi:hypothetical protein